MAASPRLQVVLPREVYDDLARIARYSDTSMSALVSQMVKEGAPILRQLADTLEQAHGLSLKLPGALTAKLDAIGRAADQVELGAQDVLDQVQDQAAELREQRGEQLRRRPSVSPGETL